VYAVAGSWSDRGCHDTCRSICPTQGSRARSVPMLVSGQGRARNPVRSTGCRRLDCREDQAARAIAPFDSRGRALGRPLGARQCVRRARRRVNCHVYRARPDRRRVAADLVRHLSRCDLQPLTRIAAACCQADGARASLIQERPRLSPRPRPRGSASGVVSGGA